MILKNSSYSKNFLYVSQKDIIFKQFSTYKFCIHPMIRYFITNAVTQKNFLCISKRYYFFFDGLSNLLKLMRRLSLNSGYRFERILPNPRDVTRLLANSLYLSHRSPVEI